MIDRARLLAIVLSASAASCRRSAPDVPRHMYVAPSNATMSFKIHFENRMSDAFRFHAVVLLLDEGSLLAREDDKAIRNHLLMHEPLHVTVALAPGSHELRTIATFVGEGSDEHGSVAGYKFELRSTHTFTAAPGGELTVIAFEKNINSAIEERPALRFEEKPGQPASPVTDAASD